MEITIISPSNEKITLKYYDILYFCQMIVEKFISESKENLKQFQQFRTQYSHFDPYFDFVVMKLKYILVNPFFHHDLYLLGYQEKYYMMDGDINKSYYELQATIPNFSFDFLPATDQNICICHHIKDNQIGFYLDSNGILYQNNQLERHLKMARLLLNQQMIHNASICFKYKKYIQKYGYYRISDFLVEMLGYTIGFPSSQNTLIYNSKMLTKEQQEQIVYCKTKFQAKSEDYYKRHH